MTAPDLYIVRHGQTDWNAAGRFQGRADVSLNAEGRHQADRLAHRLRDFLQAGAPEIVTSPLQRARQTAEQIARGLGSDPGRISVASALQELSFGRWEGMTTAEIKHADNPARRRRKTDRWNVAPPGGESYQVAAARVGDWLVGRRQPAIAVTHSGIIRIICHLAGGVPRGQAATESIPHDRILHVAGGTVRWL